MNPEDSFYGTPKKETKTPRETRKQKVGRHPAALPGPGHYRPSAQELAAHGSAFLTGARSYWTNR